MKSALLMFKNPLLPVDGEYIKEVCESFSKIGFFHDTVEILSQTDDNPFKRRFEELRNTVDCIFILSGQNVEFDIKGIIAKSTNSVLEENENARGKVDVFRDESPLYDDFSLIPSNSVLIPNSRGAYQGFLIDEDENYVFFLPNKIDQFEDVMKNFVFPYFNSNVTHTETEYVLKYFGNVKRVQDVLGQAELSMHDGFRYTYQNSYGDNTIRLYFSSEDKEQVKAVLKNITESLSDGLYAQSNISLSKALFDILLIKQMKISTAESFTGGRVASAIVKNSGASEIFNEGIVSYSNSAKAKRLNVDYKDLDESGAVSSVVAYRMAVGLLAKGDCDIAISTTGLAGPKSDNSNLPVGLCYVAIGTIKGVNTYRFNFTGDREEITEKAKNYALFLAIKKLKNNL